MDFVSFSSSVTLFLSNGEMGCHRKEAGLLARSHLVSSISLALLQSFSWICYLGVSGSEAGCCKRILFIYASSEAGSNERVDIGDKRSTAGVQPLIRLKGGREILSNFYAILLVFQQ